MCDSYYLVHKQLSAKKQLKAAVWHAKQKIKHKDNKDHEKSSQPCKYFQNGFCKSVRFLTLTVGCFQRDRVIPKIISPMRNS